MKRVTPFTIESFISKNWFQLILFGIIVFAFVKNNGSDRLLQTIPDFAMEQQGSAKSPAIQTMGVSLVSELFNSKGISPKKEVVEKAIENRPVAKRPVGNSSIAMFIERFSEVAVQEQAKYGVPASIILANGILLSDLGKSTLASEALNYFMVPCTRSWDGDSMEIGDGCFRWYGSAWESFRDHSIFLKNESITLLDSSNPTIRHWANAIEKIGWTNLKAKHIIFTIEKYNLTQFDF